ncbi:MAG: anhydro-N-acetylmuramic acid kinase [Bacteroidetes bacterium]|nr:anhydro-N-acetylmuramic acid kinase [Bacteroidota bacterium]
MNPNIEALYRIAGSHERTIVGLMSGTSVDGLDIAVCKIMGSGKHTKINVTHHTTIPYDAGFKAAIAQIFSIKNVNLEQVTILHAHIAKVHASMVLSALASWGIKNSSIDLIASHGQTIYHAPTSMHPQSGYGNATLQIGDGDILSTTTGIITISDFRQKHIAAGGEGAPLALFGDNILFASETENRVLLNMGGIANFTYLPAGQTTHIISTDVGPANTLIDSYVKANYDGLSYDANGDIASTGSINEAFVNAVLAHPFFSAAFPKTIGPELFNLSFIEAACKTAGIINMAHPDMIASLSYITARTITDGIRKVVNDTSKDLVIYASGGGIHNAYIMQQLQNLCPNASFKNLETLGIHPDAKEAVLFAILANEAVAGSPSLSMGKVSFPQ